MATNIKLLKTFIRKSGLTQAEISEQIGINPATLSRKLCAGGESFTVGEVHRLSTLLHMSNDDCMSVFFV